MLGNKPAAATLPVKDLQAAREFYENVLGLTPIQEMGEGEAGAVLYKSGDSVILVYESEYAGTNQGTPPPGRQAATSRRSSKGCVKRVSHLSTTTTCRERTGMATSTPSAT